MRLIALGTVGILLISSSALAQDQSAEVRAIALALSDERARVAELKAELERRSSVLADLSSRLESLAPAAVPTPQTATPVEQATKSSPDTPTASTVVPRFDFYGFERGPRDFFSLLSEQHIDAIAPV